MSPILHIRIKPLLPFRDQSCCPNRENRFPRYRRALFFCSPCGSIAARRNRDRNRRGSLLCEPRFAIREKSSSSFSLECFRRTDALDFAFVVRQNICPMRISFRFVIWRVREVRQICETRLFNLLLIQLSCFIYIFEIVDFRCFFFIFRALRPQRINGNGIE